MAKEEKAVGREEPEALEEEAELEEIEADETAEDEVEAEVEAEAEDEDEAEAEAEDEDDLESLSVTELRERVKDREKERDGFRRDMFRMRERARAARANQQLQEMYEQPGPAVEAPAAEDDTRVPGEIELKMNEDGKLTVDTESLLRETRRTAVPQRPTGVPLNPAAVAVAQTAANYQKLRSQLLDDADDPIQVSDTIDDLENAYGYLDRLVGTTVNEVGVLPQGEANLTEMITAEGLDRRFERRFPGVDWRKLIHAPNDPMVFRELVQSHQEKMTGNQRDRESSEDERTEKVLRTGNRPRSMKRGRRRAKPRVESKKLEDLSPDELLALTDDEVEELERATT